MRHCSSREPIFQRPTFGPAFETIASLKSIPPSGIDKTDKTGRENHAERGEIAVLPFELRHVLEIHAADAAFDAAADRVLPQLRI